MTQTFDQLDLLAPLLRAIREQGYDTPTPIQAQAIPHLLQGRDLLGIAQTGTGKTAAFALPILDFLAGEPLERRPGRPSVLILTPTRELASQIGACFGNYGRHVDVRHAVIFGGVGQKPQVDALRRGVDVLVATPGRLLDLMDQGHIHLDDIEVFVLDEADRMLDMGFQPAVKRVTAKLPRDRQSLLFSATMPEDIVSLAHSILREPVRVEVTPPATTVDRIAQSVLFVDKQDKRALLGEVLQDATLERVLVFTRTKHGADRVVKHLRRLKIAAEAIHGNKSQGARERALEALRSGKARVLVATDIAARGLDIRDITHVVNFDLPNIPESYVHRIGRTARAGRDGVAISFCAGDEVDDLRAIERETRQSIPVVEDHPYAPEGGAPAPAAPAPKTQKPRGGGGGRSRRRGPRNGRSGSRRQQRRPAAST